MKGNLKRVFSILLVAVMLISLMPMPQSSAIASGLNITSDGASPVTSVPTSLTDGAIWADKSVINNGSGSFDIELKAIGQDYKISNPKPLDCLDVVLVLDTSGSMGDKINGVSKLRSMKTAAKQAVDTLLSVNGNRVAIVEYASYGDVISDFSTNATDLKNKIERFEDGGGTNIQHAYYTAQNLISTKHINKPVIILMSDGRPTYYYDFDSDPTLSNVLGTGDDDDTDEDYVMNTIKQAMAVKNAGTDIYT